MNHGEDVYYELEKFVFYLASTNQDPDNVMLEYDEIVGELLMEMAKGIKYYENLPKDQLLAVIRRMMDNRISELKFRYYVSGRRIPVKLTISLDVEIGDGATGNTVVNYRSLSSDSNSKAVHEVVSDEMNVEQISDSINRVEEVRSRLSEIAGMVFDSVVFGNIQLNDVMLLAAIRAATVFKSKKTVIKPRHVADALMLTEKDVRKAFKEIRMVYAEVCNG